MSLGTKSIAGSSFPSSPSPSFFVSVDVSSMGINVNPGDVLSIGLSSQTSLGYRWYYTSDSYAGGRNFVLVRTNKGT